MPRRVAHPIQLHQAEAACLEAVCTGADTKTRIALRAGLDLTQTEAVLRSLATGGLIRKHEGRWCPTQVADTASIAVAPDAERRRGGNRHGEVQPGTSAHRLLALLTRPRRGTELTAELGVTHQRVHQLVVRLAALGLVRIGDLDRPSLIVARSGDRAVLLRAAEEAVLSSFPDTAGTTLIKISQASRRTPEETAELMGILIEKGLVEAVGPSRRVELYRLTPSGHEHWQRRPAARTADLPALPVRSDRVRLVLAHLAEHGPTRTHNVGHALEIPRPSVNALMQYLKRLGLVRKSTGDLHAPHELTSEGEETLRAMLKGRQ